MLHSLITVAQHTLREVKHVLVLAHISPLSHLSVQQSGKMAVVLVNACCNMPIHSILLTAPQLSISQKALGTLPEDGNVMPKHVGATIHN
jgi:hypothetical protein